MVFQHSLNRVSGDRPNENGPVWRTNRYVLTIWTKSSSCPVETDFKPIGAEKKKKNKSNFISIIITKLILNILSLLKD